MPAVDTFTSLLLVSVAGRPLPATVSSLLLAGRITDAANLPDSFELEFTDSGGTVLADGGFEIGKPVVLTVSENGAQGPQRLIDGEVTAIDREDVAGSLRTRVRGFDRSHRLSRGRRVAAFVDQTVADIVRKVASGAGVRVDRIEVPVSSVMKHVTQDNVSDWVFLKRLADASGCTFSVLESGLVFTPRTPANEAPAGAESARDDPVVIEHGLNTIWLTSTVTAASQVSGVEVRGWDPKQKKAVISKAKPETRSVDLATLKPEKVAKTFTSPEYVSPTGDGVPNTQDVRAKAVADRIAGGFAEVEARVLGNSHLHSGTAVTLKGYGVPFDGRYTVSEAVHEFSAEAGYTTTVVVSNASDRSLLGLASGGAFGGASIGDPASRMPGVVSALVSDIDDPENAGRVKLAFPYLSDDYVSGWARTVQFGAGAKRGAVFMPEVGDEVLVAFEGGRFDRPYVIGGLYNGRDEPKTSWAESVKGGKVERRSFTSRTGMEVVFVEQSGTETLEVSTTDGKQRITLTQTGQKGIEIISEGPVTVTAKADATVKADQGKLALSGQSVQIKATGELSIEGATLALKGTQSAEVKAAMLTLKADATAELSASGITTVKGSMVKIN
ncbi:Uncharacterized conserved protein, implicated in type VI secretion and phage assembly [Agromyces sp. CF514]|uniref:VgrG-related protein n=1 Tax=Agromyces sp. CF514 TaxID=1881031 RepID=UPI0008E26FE4|nr:VgrG-related protein [Agromyces sp. CF514]SFR69268.1 Uncharacterized conserved protein, implicated in type VI secretion and phage assembly [Agromyces sp. CF514]